MNENMIHEDENQEKNQSTNYKIEFNKDDQVL